MFVWREDTSPSPLVRRSLRENGPHERAATPRLVAKRLRLTDGLTTAKRTRKKKRERRRAENIPEADRQKGQPAYTREQQRLSKRGGGYQEAEF